MVPSCIACGGGRLIRVGPLPKGDEDGALSAPPGGPTGPGDLWRCRECDLSFRHPSPTDEELTRYYEQLPSESLWTYGPHRLVWGEIARMLEEVPDRSVLDVGCFRGDLLNYLGGTWRRYGVEPCESARREAERRGIEILARSVGALPDDGRRFGAITLVDVIEHLTRPGEALERLARRLLPGGKLVIFTGSTDAWSWRLSGVHYWYCALREHVAFFSPAWFRWAAPRLGLEVREVLRRPHRPATRRERLDEALKNLAYISYRRLEGHGTLRPVLEALPLVRRIGRWDGAWWTTARDHVLVLMVKEVGALGIGG